MKSLSKYVYWKQKKLAYANVYILYTLFRWSVFIVVHKSSFELVQQATVASIYFSEILTINLLDLSL